MIGRRHMGVNLDGAHLQVGKWKMKAEEVEIGGSKTAATGIEEK